MIIAALIMQASVPVQPSPISLGPVGTTLLVIALVVLSFLALRQKNWKEAAAAAAASEKAAQNDLVRARETIAQLRTDKDRLIDRCAKLEASRDLTPLETTVSGWINESRDRFTKAMQELTLTRKDTTNALTSLNMEMNDQRKVFLSAFSELTKAFTDHIEDDKLTHTMRQDQTERIASILDSLEKRTSAQGRQLSAIGSKLDKL